MSVVTVDLRPYQEEAVRAVVAYAVNHPNGSLLLTIPPGGGKTIVAASVLRMLVHDHSLHALVIAHRREIVNQHREHLIRCGVPEADVGVVAGPRKETSRRIVVASVDTLRRMRDKPSADVLVSDEAHRDASDGRSTLRSMYPRAFRLGITGTPIRLDRRALRGEYDDMIVTSSPSELILGNWIVAPAVYTVDPGDLPDVRHVSASDGDYSTRDLGRVMNQPKLVGDIVDHWQRLAAGRQTVVFASDIRHSREIARRFDLAGIRSGHLDQATRSKERSSALSDFASGKITVLSCVNILSEGWDNPSCKCIVMARPTKSLGLYLQQAGRCMRPWNDVGALILDHAGNAIVQRHGLPQDDRAWSLDPRPRRSQRGEPPAKRCASCGAVSAAAALACSACRAPFPARAARETEESDGDLVEHRRLLSDEEKSAELARIASFARSRGFPPGWAAQVYRAKYGDDPPPVEAS